MSEANIPLAAEMQHGRGVYAHQSLPSGVHGPILCFWETRAPMTAESLREFIEGPAQPAGSPDALTTRVYTIDETLGGLAQPSAWPMQPKPTGDSTGSYFWCAHGFESDEAAAAFFARTTSASPVGGLESPMPGLLHFHSYLPTGIRATDPMFSVWETREPMSADDFQGFIDGPSSPFAGATSKVYKVGPMATPPPSAFPHRVGSFVGRMMMPLMDDTMQIWDTMMPILQDAAGVTSEVEQFDLVEYAKEKLDENAEEEEEEKEEETVAAAEEDKDAALFWKVEAALETPLEIPMPARAFEELYADEESKTAAARTPRQQGGDQAKGAGGDNVGI